ncbi:LPD7 domain-containing protein [Brevundimonas sp.]|uniref:LPD7 domain-containing protein n=1 Tax=Brevundimonas sp. TaxID=1871086 RepID=UPI0025BD6F8F|nr:LPD7 domain-containing protein [Brevundimonas sp.]
MRTPTQTAGSVASENAVSPSPQKRTGGRSVTKGEIPASILDRYLIERDRQGRPERFYRDHRAVDPMFRDEGKRLVTRQAYPDAVADMLKVAQHRGWTQVRVSGDETFRREAWVQARALGVDVKGYQPRDRDRQAAGDKVREPPTGPDRSAGPSAISAERRLKEAAIVVRRLITDPAAQARLIEHAYQRARDMIPGLPRHPDGDRSPRRESDRIRR